MITQQRRAKAECELEITWGVKSVRVEMQVSGIRFSEVPSDMDNSVEVKEVLVVCCSVRD